MNQLIIDLELCYREIPSLRSLDVKNPTFKTWEARCRRLLKKLFGPESDEVSDFDKIQFWYLYGTRYYEKISKQEFDDNHFRNGIDEAELLLKDLISEAKYLNPKNEEKTASTANEKRVFISHSSDDDLIGKEVINMLQLIGVKPNQIFYTSAAGYGIPLGKDWVETLRSEVSGGGIALSLLSENYFNSQICLLEMGATWVLSKFHVPILIPPLTFRDTNDLINSTQGFQILDRPRWSSLKKDLEKLFDLEPLDGDKWEPQRDAILKRIENHLQSE